ncbi:uncharacterized protein SPPG_07347 [Spizellomyces punctatus DAOM BR117]|uniref:Aminopeptidase n=1 Tax=Spizellomyces punctatus (strain DAOM BR117) TaxID=645134 RepID=A0A0L0H7A8_SPIPD|nr:uncharacterized protein SPPG_07347 [Spizellomyces punctatus DAOM BR117]KNC97425.1 hypothetical protein SPPG_07347 [Spizellomyces punctatus DAOM BR117]|eukprot:XP_016605465.1 hypothetical protein SPPG_07347 [Spizellomyces punctatus DAOM BR117]
MSSNASRDAPLERVRRDPEENVRNMDVPQELDPLLPGQETNRGRRQISWGTLFPSDRELLTTSHFRRQRKWMIPLATVVASTILFLIILKAFTRHEPTQARQPGTWLPTSIVARTYTLDFMADLETAIFNGQANVTIEVLESTSNITFHSVGLELSDTFVHHLASNTIVFPSSAASDPDNGMTILHFSKVIRPMNYTLVISYKGHIGDRTMHGFYRSPYRDASTDEVRYVAATHFEPFWARHAFPCFDEPSLKAEFRVAITVRKGLYALSNMPAARIHDLDASADGARFTRFEFQPTPPMSTYLAAWAIGDFKSVENKTESGVDMRVFFRPGQQSDARYPLHVALRSLEFFESQYGIPFPLPKLDLFPMPDFSGDAMENFGLMIFEEDLLMSSETSSAEDKQTIALLVAHEIAHQWFGDIVTMRWWNDLWLNEGFAEFMQYQAVSAIEPSWDLESQFFYMEHVLAFRADSSSFTHPVTMAVDDQRTIPRIFDDITYDKGAAIVGMLKSWMNSKTDDRHMCGGFCQGIRKYLTRCRFGVATTADLWADMSAIVGTVDGDHNVVRSMMDTWVSRPGYPVITVIPENGVLRLSQRRFTLWASPENTEDQTWVVPFEFAILSDVKSVHSVTLRDPTSLFPISELSPESLILANPNRTGFYRTQYGATTYKLLSELLLTNPTSLRPADRAGIVSDVIALVLSNRVIAQDGFPCLLFLKRETDPIVWLTASDALKELEKSLGYHVAANSVRAWFRRLLEDIVVKVGWKAKAGNSNDQHMQDLMRRAILSLAIDMQEQQVTSQAMRYFSALLDNKEDDLPSEELLDLVYIAAVRNTSKNFDIMFDLYTKQSGPKPAGDILSALASTQDSAQIDRLLDLLQKQDLVSPSERMSAIETVATASPLACSHLLPFIFDFYSSSKSGRMAVAVENAIAGCPDMKIIEQWDDFARKRDSQEKPGEADRLLIGLKRGLERATTGYFFRTERGDEVLQWVSERLGENPSERLIERI